MLFKRVNSIPKMEQEECIHQGFLLLPPVGKLLKKSWQQKYCMLFKASKFGMERLEVYDAVDSKDYKIITLENCIKINSKSLTTFVITSKSGVYEFGALTEQSMNEWLSAIQSVAFPDEVSKMTSIEEDNDLYCSSGEGVFNVKLHPSPVSINCGLESKTYTLVLTSTALQLRNIIDNKLLFTWPYCYIRRYGYKSGKFTFEAGRKCESGEGTFYLEHQNQQEIFRCLATKMKSMKKLLSGETSPLLDCGEDQFQAALLLAPRSRTPLVPSPTIPSLQSISDSSISSKSQLSQMSSISSELESKNIPFSLKSVKPNKPPRKFIPLSKPLPEQDPTYEPIQKYDEIEYRNNAWQTLGIDAPDHTEQIAEEEDYMSWGEIKKQKEAIKKPLAPTIITQNTPVDTGDTYDKLNYFGSTSKINSKSPYKQVFPVPVNPVSEPLSYNEYDEVQCFTEENQGKKDPNDDKVNHQFHNEEAYAVISKPKRV
ncbi:uncharacterized protein Dok [Diabrotica undecimpunctata]|uniref:uncharacterized protein Dok n=1 Tax=Diabrotica undecimpunctata TaxID=50387 RepID=UPI003B63718B